MDVLYTLLLAEKLNKGRGPGRGLLQIGPERRAGGFLWHLKMHFLESFLGCAFGRPLGALFAPSGSQGVPKVSILGAKM